MFGCSFVQITDLHAATISTLRSTFVTFYRGLFIILLFPELSPPITKKYFQIKLSCVVENDEKLTHIIRSRAVFIQEPRKFLPIDSNDHQTDSKAS